MVAPKDVFLALFATWRDNLFQAVRVAPFALLLLPAGAAIGAEPPAIRRDGVVNAASQRPGAAGGAIAPASRISIHGVRFAPEVQANRVLLRGAGRSLTLPVLRATTTRLEAWIPAGAPLGTAALSVQSNGLESQPVSIRIDRSAPGFFSVNEEGWGLARADNLSAGVRAPNSGSRAVAPGGTVALAVTGLSSGLSSADHPQVFIGFETARVLSFRPPAAPDYYAEISIQVPPGAPEGCHVPVYARGADGRASNTVGISIHRGGGACVDGPDDPLSGWDGGKTAILIISRTVRRAPSSLTSDPPQGLTEDEVRAGFFDLPPGRRRDNPFLPGPPTGACTTYTTVPDAETPAADSVPSLLLGSVFRAGEGLDAGAYLVARSGSLQLRAAPVMGAPGLYQRILNRGGNGGAHPGLRGPQFPLDSGMVVIAGRGGPQAGTFATALPVPAEFTQLSQMAAIRRSDPLTVEWKSAGSPAAMAIVVSSAGANGGAAGATYCLAPGSAGRFTIPAALLAHLPAGRGDLVLASWWRRTVTPNPAGIEHTIALSVYSRSSEVQIQ
jgi:uncharacterized protein (TIGR03437 family)